MLKAIKQSRELQILSLIVFIALVLRLIGIQHGFPFIFHPDEPAVVRSATGIRFDPNPGHFDWPHLHFYLNYFVHFLFIKFRGFLQVIGLQEPIAKRFPLLWSDPLVFYWLSRVFDAFLGAFTAIPLFLAGKKLKNAKTGLLAAAVLAVFPHHVHVSHFALIDVPTVFWLAWALYFSVNIFKEFRIKDYLLAGLFIGFAASTKYNGGLAAIVVFTAHLLRVLENKENFFSLDNLKALIFSGLMAIAGFIIGTPYSVLDFPTFIGDDSPNGAMWQFTNVGSVAFPLRIQQFFKAITTQYLFDYGVTFIAIFTLFSIYATFKMRKRYCLVLIPALFLLFYTAGFAKFRIHYFMTAYPFMMLAIALAFSEFIEKKSKVLQNVLLVLVFSLPIILSGYRIYVLTQKDTKVELYEWMQQNIVLTDKLIYNSSSIAPVLDKFDNPATKEITIENINDSSPDYAFVHTESGSPGFFAPVTKLVVHDDAKLLSDEGFELVETISPLHRRGNKIYIYKRAGDL